jgi:hypothetical protein
MPLPPEICDDILGHLDFDQELDCYRGTVQLGDHCVRFSVDLDEDGDIGPSLARARQVVQDLQRYGEAVKDYAVTQLLALKNDGWLVEDEEEITPEQFKRRMTLYDFSISADGLVLFWHRDGNLFGRHTIEIAMDGSNHFIDANLVG